MKTKRPNPKQKAESRLRAWLIVIMGPTLATWLTLVVTAVVGYPIWADYLRNLQNRVSDRPQLTHYAEHQLVKGGEPQQQLADVSPYQRRNGPQYGELAPQKFAHSPQKYSERPSQPRAGERSFAELARPKQNAAPDPLTQVAQLPFTIPAIIFNGILAPGTLQSRPTDR